MQRPKSIPQGRLGQVGRRRMDRKGYLAKIAKKVIFLPQYGSSLTGENVETVSGNR